MLIIACAGVEVAPRPAAPRVETPDGTGGVNHPSVVDRPHVVLVSFDGFRHDYLARFDTPSFDRLVAAGVRADGLITSLSVTHVPGALLHRDRPVS